VIHRHLDIPPGRATEDLPSAAIVDLLERGDLDDWRPIARAVARDPEGAFAARVSRLLDEYPIYGTSALWRAFLVQVRARAEGAGDRSRPVRLSTLRHRLGLTQVEVAGRMGISQSDLSKLERRRDVRLSTLRAYLEALGMDLQLMTNVEGERLEIKLHDG
jgi:DNA-binding Xre family transcriptional regulator